MSIQIVQSPALETGPFSQNRRVMNIPMIADNGVVDAENSALTFDIYMNTTDLLPWVFNEYEGATNAGQPLTPASLIRDYTLTSDRLGQIIGTRNVANVVNENLNHYKYSTAQAEAKSLFQGNSNQNQGRFYKTGIPQSPFLLQSVPTSSDVEESTQSQLRTAAVRLPLGDLHPLYQGKTRFPVLGMGNLNHRFLLEGNINVISLPVMPGPFDCDDVNAATIGSTSDPSQATSLVLTTTYELDTIPLYIGAPVTVEWTDTGGDQTANTTIAGLYHDSANLNVGVRLATPPAVAGGAATNVVLAYRSFYMSGTGNDADITDAGNNVSQTDWFIQDAQLEIHRYVYMNPKGLSNYLSSINNRILAFNNYIVMDDTMTPTKSYNYTISSIPRSAFALVVLISFNAGERGLLSSRNNCDSYRIAIDGYDTTDRNVRVGASDTGADKTLVVGRGIHNDRLMQLFNALGTPLQRFDMNRFNYLQKQDTQAPSYFMIPQLIPNFNDNATHQLTFDMYSDGDNMQQSTIHYIFFIKQGMRVQDGMVTGLV